MTDTAVETIVSTITEAVIEHYEETMVDKAPECETIYQLMPVPAGCNDVAKFTVRFKPHGCGRGTQLACSSCVEFYMTQRLACVWCDGAVQLEVVDNESMSKSRAKGTLLETAVTNYLREWYPDVKRNPLAGNKDVGDINLGAERRFVLEVKNVAKLNLPGWVKEAKVEAANLNDTAVGVVVRKRHGVSDASQQWCTLTLEDLMILVNFLSEPSPKAFR